MFNSVPSTLPPAVGRFDLRSPGLPHASKSACWRATECEARGRSDHRFCAAVNTPKRHNPHRAQRREPRTTLPHRTPLSSRGRCATRAPLFARPLRHAARHAVSIGASHASWRRVGVHGCQANAVATLRTPRGGRRTSVKGSSAVLRSAPGVRACAHRRCASPRPPATWRSSATQMRTHKLSIAHAPADIKQTDGHTGATSKDGDCTMTS